MTPDPTAQFDQTVLDMIEHSPGGVVPNTPSHQDALKRLYAAHQVYAHADHKGGHVTVRSLSALPSFVAHNLDAVAGGAIAITELESNDAIFTRYVQSLPATLHARAESLRATVAVRPPHHRAKAQAAQDPLHSLFLVPGTGPHHGLPGNYLHGALLESAAHAWVLALHDCDDGVALLEAPTLAAAVTALREVVACAPFHLEELEALGFQMP